MDDMTNTKKAQETKLHECACGRYTVNTQGQDLPKRFRNRFRKEGHGNTYNTGCAGVTKGTFAQGHDAKLVGFLQMAKEMGATVSYTANGKTVTTDPDEAADSTLSATLARKVRMFAGKPQAPAKATPAKKAPATPAKKAPAPRARRARKAKAAA